MDESNVNGGSHPKPHIWNQRPRFAYSLYNFYGATTMIKGSLRNIVGQFNFGEMSCFKQHNAVQ